jgi:hypothetical protein
MKSKIQVQQKSIDVFIKLSILIFIVTGCAKLISVFGDSELLIQRDPIFQIVNFRVVMLFVGSIEILLAAYIFSVKSLKVVLLTIFIFSIMLILYRFGLYWIDYNKPCSCLGNVADMIGVSDVAADRIMILVLLFLFAGSSLSLWSLGFQKK